MAVRWAGPVDLPRVFWLERVCRGHRRLVACRQRDSAVTLRNKRRRHMTKLTEYQKQVTDEMLMVRYQRGQRVAFETLVARYASSVFSVGYYLLGSEAQADKLAQETFLQVVREAATFNLETQFRAWLFGLMHKTAVGGYQVEPTAEASDEKPTAESSLIDSAPISSRAYRSQILARRVASRVSTLTFPVREAFLLKQTAQLSMNDIAQALGIDTDTVKLLIRTAFDKLQECVADTEEYARALR